MDTYKIQTPLKSFTECFIWQAALNCNSISYKTVISPEILEIDGKLIFRYEMHKATGDSWEGAKFSCPVKDIRINGNIVQDTSVDKIKKHVEFDYNIVQIEGEIDTSINRADLRVLKSYFSVMNYYTIRNNPHKSQ